MTETTDNFRVDFSHTSYTIHIIKIAFSCEWGHLEGAEMKDRALICFSNFGMWNVGKVGLDGRIMPVFLLNTFVLASWYLGAKFDLVKI